MDYLLKSSAILMLFYLCYQIFLRKETFFQSNRWFFIIGLVVALFLPSIVIPIYIEYTPIEVENIPFSFSEASTINNSQNAQSINWLEILTWIYLIGVSVFSLKLLLELFSLHRLIQKNPKKKIERFSLIEIFEHIAPFSFFKWIVYNPNQFEKQELKHIINHEKIHAKEHHTLDILFVQICCALFWFNPLIWLYKKELQQNLEFIADYKAQQISNCKSSYQKLLLKASLPNHQLVLTNNFYNSLIKKRIIMLHKSKSNKLNAWKYALVIPALALFLMSFNTEEVYVAKEMAPTPIVQKDFIVSPESADKDLQLITNYFKNKPVQLIFTEIRRNSQNQLQSLTLNTKYADGKDYTKRVTVSKENNDVITAFQVSFNSIQTDIKLNFLEESLDSNLSENQIKLSQTGTLTTKKPIADIVNKEHIDQSLGKDPLYIIGNKQYKKADLPSNSFTTNGSITQLNKQEAKKRFGNAGSNGAIILNGKTTFGNQNLTTYVRRGEIIINKDFSDADLNLAKAKLEKEGFKVKIRGVKRNSNGEITAIKIDVSSNNAKANYNLNGDEPIKPIQISFDNNGENISIGNGISNNYPVVVGTRKIRNQRNAFATKGRLKTTKHGSSYIISTDTHQHNDDHNCEEDCEHDHDVKFEYHIDSEDHKDGNTHGEVVVKGTNTYVIKNSNSNNGKRIVTITNDKGEDELIELKSKDNVYVLKSKDGVISSNNLTWVNDDDAKVEYQFKSKKKGNSFFFSTDDGEKPYVLLDGKEISYKELNDLNSDTIKNVNIIKGKSAINKYGQKAKDGAIIITTKE